MFLTGRAPTVRQRLRPRGGSLAAAPHWIAGVDGLYLHHLYRAMAWLGEELPAKDQDGRTPFAPRCIEDLIEERLLAHPRRDLFTRLYLVFMDTTSLGLRRRSVARRSAATATARVTRPDLRQMILEGLIDGDGWPAPGWEMWPVNTARRRTPPSFR